METSKIILVVISIIFILSLFSNVFGKKTNNVEVGAYVANVDAGGCWKAPANPFVTPMDCFDANVISYRECIDCCGEREGCKQGCWNKRIGSDHICFRLLR